MAEPQANAQTTPAAAPSPEVLHIDGQPMAFVAGESVIQTATRNQLEIPHYCWHPRLSIAANCRMCLVEVEKAPKLVPACQTESKAGMVVHTQNERVKTAQRQVHEFLLVNHPIDCPICDQAGECKLQDYYMRYHLTPSRMREPKVYKPKLTRLGPHVVYNAQRCIMCTRCVRFMDEVAHERQLGVMNRGDHSEIGIFPGQPLNSAYSLNTVDVCPVGALTSTAFRFKQRVWNLKRSPSICSGCAKGCNVHIDQRSKQVYRMLPRENEHVNKSWMCDEGRLTYNRANERRLHEPLVKDGDFLQPMPAAQALPHAAELLKPHVPNSAAWAIGISLQSTIEEAACVASFVREVLPEARVFALAYADGTADKILRHADKNANRAGIARIFAHANIALADDAALVAHLQSGQAQAALLLGHETANAAALAPALAGCAAVVHLAANHTQLTDAAHVTLPALSWVESDGTWLSGEQRLQRLQPAFAPAGETRSMRDWLAQLAQAWQSAWQPAADTLAQQQQLAAPQQAFAGVDFSHIDALGQPLAGANETSCPAAEQNVS